MRQSRDTSDDLIWESPSGPELAAGFRLGRAASGAVTGLVLAAVYSLVAGTIDAVLMRDVPLRVDWPAVWGSLALAGLGGAGLGALTAWPEAGWAGILAGAVGFVAWSFLQSFLRLQAATLIFLPLFLPLVAMSVPLAAFLRWSAGRQERLQDQPGAARWRAQALLLIVVLAVGGFAGSWSQMPASSREAVRRVHRVLTETLAEPAGARLPAAFGSVPDLRRHAGSPYQLEPRAVNSMNNQVDVLATFADGYQITCTVDPTAGWLLCREGAEALFGGAVADPSDQR